MIIVEVRERKTDKLYATCYITKGYNGGNWVADYQLEGDTSDEANLIKAPDKISMETAIRERFQSYNCIFKDDGRP